MHPPRTFSRIAGLVIALATGLALVLSSFPAQAGPQERRQDLVTEAATIAELLGNGRPPAKLTKRTLKRRYDYQLEKPIQVASYKRLKQGTEYRVCVRHPRGGTASFSSVKGGLKSSGRGKACRF